MKIRLTQHIANTYEIPSHINVRQQELVDEGGTGLYMLVTQSGSKTFYLRYRSAENGNKTTHVKLGRATDITLAQARDKVKKLRAEIALGDDPQAKIKEKRNEMTYGEFMEDYFFPYIEPRRRSAGTYRQMHRSHIQKAFDNIKVNQITKRQVQAFHNDLRKQGLANGTCNRYLQLIKSSINVGINIMEVINIKNPAVGIPLFEEQGRERYLNAEELYKLIPVLMENNGQIAKIIRFLLATGLRLGECLHCEWEHIDIQNKVMVIPSKNAKSKKTDSIPLNDAAIQVLEECDKNLPPFYNLATKKAYVSIKKGFKNLMQQAEIEGVTAHTLRHSFASMLLKKGSSLSCIQRILRHSDISVTQKYAHLSPASVQAASDTISEQLMRVTGNQG